VVPGLNGPGPGGAVHVYLRNNRGEFGPKNIHTYGLYHAAFANDAWTINKHVTLNAGLRWEQQSLNGDSAHYTFTDNWSPRVGISVDPVGDRKTKVYANFGRYNYAIPLDMAERSLSNELDFQGVRFAPSYHLDASGNRIADLTSFGSVIPIPDAAHVLNRANTAAANFDANGACINPAGCGSGGGAGISLSSITAIAPGTRMQYLDEFVVGFEREIWGGAVLSVRYLDRRLKRIVEDTSGIAPEAYFASLNQIYAITNPGPATDIFTNPIEHTYAAGGTPPAECTNPNNVVDPVQDSAGNTLGAACFEDNGVNGVAAGTNTPDGIPDGFPAPVRNYQAVEIEVNKSFSKNWLMRANWRIAKLSGNYEGAFRNDNAQSDPSISSLYDFVAGDFNLLGDQFTPGPLNTDRHHIVNGFFSYVFDKSALRGLTLGTGVNLQTGVPLSSLKAHPAYFNQGEIPFGGRGSLGRSPFTGSVDLHAEYAHPLTERTRIRFGADLFNIANAKRALIIDQNQDVTFGVPNLDYLKGFQAARNVSGYQRPFYARLMVKFEF
jgi:TonB dependent receptor